MQLDREDPGKLASHDNNQQQVEEKQAIEESLRDLNLSRPGPDPELLPEGLLPFDPPTSIVRIRSCMALRWLGIPETAQECSQYDEAADSIATTQTHCD